MVRARGGRNSVPGVRTPPTKAYRVPSILLVVLCCVATRSSCSSPRSSTSSSVRLEWRDLNYKVSVHSGGQQREKQILRGLHGVAEPGHLVAIMGPTGSGKTSLLNALAARTVACKGAELSGSFLVNGKARSENEFRRLSAYVQQDDVLYAHQTVRETLMMAAKLRLRGAQDDKEREAFVGRLISQLGLVKAEHTEIGNARVRGVSGGERKRTNLGIELISDPPVIFLDEPTSGLDSFQAESVVRVLGKLAANGRTVICSIHQPSSSIFALFDRLLILSEGQGMYYGPAREAVGYFSGLGFGCPQQYNPADYFLDLVSIDYRSEEAAANSSRTVAALAAAFEARSRHATMAVDAATTAEEAATKVVPLVRMRSLRDIFSETGALEPPPQPSLLAPSPSREASPGAGAGGRYSSSWLTQFRALHDRCRREVYRDRAALMIRSTTNMVFALALAALYSKKDIDAQKAVQDRTGALFFMVVNQAFGFIGPVLGSFTLERGVVIRERMAKCYHLSAYYAAKLASELPVVALLPCVFGSVVYPALRMHPTPGRFGLFLCILVINALAATSLGMVVSAGTTSIKAASSLSPVVMVLMLLFGGYYVNAANIPSSIRWITNLSFVKFSFTSLAVNEFRGLSIPCGASEGADCVRSGDRVLERLSFDGKPLATLIAGELGLVFGINLLAFTFLRRNLPRFQQVVPPTIPSPLSAPANSTAAADK